jgi:uncharacterized protein YbcV (DUF1398 family)
MFSLQQIQTAHAKVKSGADFPAYVQEMKSLGVTTYEHFVDDGHIQYIGENDFTLSAPAKWEAIKVPGTASTQKLKDALTIHQQGQTGYPTFCQQSADAGVEKWTVDMMQMTCTYYDKAGNPMLVETIPEI